MPDYIIQSARLVPYAKRPKQGSGYVNVYVNEPEPDSPAAPRGSLYVVSEALIGGRASEDVIDIIIATFGDQYYNRATDQPFPLARFEHAIKATNRELAAHVDRGNASWIGKLSSVIAVIVDDEVHIAHTGSAEGFLARGKTCTRITSGEPTRPATPTKTFGSIASGELEIGDRLLFCTPALVHQVPLAKLSGVLRHNTPNTALSELTSLLQDATPERVGAIICEITTPELAALQLRPEEPSEIALGAPENAIQAAKLAAAPLADTTKSTTHKLHQVSRRAYQTAKPLARRAGLATAAGIRNFLRQRWGRRAVAVLVALIIIIGLFSLIAYQQDQRSTQLFNQYQSIYRDYTGGQAATGQAALSQTQRLQSRLEALKSQSKAIDQLLANSNLFDKEPTTYAAFANLLSERIDALTGLQQRDTVLIKDLSAQNQSADFIEQVGSKLIIFSSGKSAGIRIMNTATAGVTDSRASLANLGAITATTASANSDGVYILTSTPEVWFYSLTSDTISRQPIAFGAWPSGSAIASYASNLYILSNSTVYKFVKSATGYSPQTVYAKLEGPAAGATSLAIDGSVYVLADTALTEYLAGAVQATATLPLTLSSTSRLRSEAGGKVVTAVQAGAGRVIVFETTAGKLQFSRQLASKSLTKLSDAVYDSTTGSIWLLSDNKLYSIGLSQ